MNVLVTAASKHGGTTGIAERIGATLARHGLTVVTVPVEEVDSVDGFDAVIVGSAVYAGHWMKPARELVTRHAAALVDRPVWLFSSGPIGDPPKPTEEPVDVADLVAGTRAAGHQVFAGVLDRSRLGFGERALVAALRAPYGDYRDWTAVERWADEVADTLATAGTAAS